MRAWTGAALFPLRETYAIGGEFLSASMNAEMRRVVEEMGADLCQTTTIVRVFLRCGRRILT